MFDFKEVKGNGIYLCRICSYEERINEKSFVNCSIYWCFGIRDRLIENVKNLQRIRITGGTMFVKITNELLL